jgi:uncharacterized protein
VERMNILPSRKLRGLAGGIALAACAALAVPSAQAAPAGSTVVQPTPVQGETAKVSTVDSSRDAGWTVQSAYNAVRYSKLYNTGRIPTSGCKRPNVALNTEYRVRYFEQELVRCMYAVWKTNLWRAGSAKWSVKPNLVVHGYNTINTACGSVTGWTSFYCSAGNGTIYIPWRQIVTYYAQNPTFAVAYATNTIAHEYGHHVQAMSGILTASWWRQQRMTGDAALAESRRRELQASCLGSAYIGSNKVAYPMSGGLLQQWYYVISHSGDQPGQPRDHGSMANHNFWSLAGWKGNGTYQHPGSCQTWAASGTRIY